tara:strand:- start:1 stop:429 length:429 start_codon:yes stop_codon:yes gene_type:complete
MTQKSFDFIDTENRLCTKCDTNKPTSNFYKSGVGNILRGNCIECYQKSNNMRGRLQRGFASLKTDHCECCGKLCDTQMDHDHDLDAFRGFVCLSCNLTMGKQQKRHGTMESIINDRPESVGDCYIKYYKTATLRAGLTWKAN